MAKLISVIIPYYTETPQDIFPLLSSLNNQVGVDFDQIECILVNDGNGNALPEEFLGAFFHLQIRCVMLEENGGPGVARQAGLDNALGEYVMFCDADDVLHSVAVLGAFVAEVNASHPDIITTPWLEEIRDAAGSYSYLNHEDEATWMHGKLFRRVFLQGNNIRFHPELRVHEDSYFLAIAFALTVNIVKLLFTSYVWKFVPSSITRRNGGAYTYESAVTFIQAIGLSFAELEKLAPQELPYKTVQLVHYHYFCLHQPHWLAPERQEYLAAAEAALKEMIAPYWHHYMDAPPEFIATVYNQERAKSFGGCIEAETLDEWLNRLELDRARKLAG